MCQITLHSHPLNINLSGHLTSHEFKSTTIKNTKNKIIIIKKKSELTDQTAAEEQSLNKTDFVLLTTYEVPLRHGRGFGSGGPRPRTGFELTKVFKPGIATRSSTGPVRFSIGEDHDHCMKSLKSPSEACEDEMSELPRAELAAVFLEHVVDSEPLRVVVVVVMVDFGRWEEGRLESGLVGR